MTAHVTRTPLVIAAIAASGLAPVPHHSQLRLLPGRCRHLSRSVTRGLEVLIARRPTLRATPPLPLPLIHPVVLYSRLPPPTCQPSSTHQTALGPTDPLMTLGSPGRVVALPALAAPLRYLP